MLDGGRIRRVAECEKERREPILQIKREIDIARAQRLVHGAAQPWRKVGGRGKRAAPAEHVEGEGRRVVGRDFAEFPHGPNFGGATARTIVRKGYASECPNVAKLLQNLRFDLDYENIGMNAIMTDGADPVDTAKGLIAKRPELLAHWLAGVKTRDGGDGLKAAQDALLAE